MSFHKVVKDVTTEPNGKDYSFILTAGWLCLVCAIILKAIDVILTHTFEAAEFLDALGKFIGTIGTVYAIFYGIHTYGKTKLKNQNNESL